MLTHFKENPTKLFILLLFLIIMVTLLSYARQISFQEFLIYKEALKIYVYNNLIFSLFIFFILNIFFINSPFPVSTPLKFTAGFLFGTVLGTLLNVIFTTIGIIVGFLLTRYIFKEALEKKYNSQLHKINKEIKKHGLYYFASARITLIIPYFLITIIGGLSNITLKKYTLATIIGVFPGSFLYAYSGSKVEQLTSFNDIFTVDLFLLLLGFAILFLLPALFNHAKEKAKKLKSSTQ